MDIEHMDIEHMDIEQIEREAKECLEKMKRESERAEKKCVKILEALEFLVNENEN